MLHNTNRPDLAPPQSVSRKEIRTKLMLSKPLFIVYGRVKGFLLVILQYIDTFKNTLMNIMCNCNH